jgi:hypothetical protein
MAAQLEQFVLPGREEGQTVDELSSTKTMSARAVWHGVDTWQVMLEGLSV